MKAEIILADKSVLKIEGTATECAQFLETYKPTKIKDVFKKIQYDYNFNQNTWTVPNIPGTLNGSGITYTLTSATSHTADAASSWTECEYIKN